MAGAQKTPADRLKKRAQSKALTGALLDGLIRLGERTPLRFAYARSTACASVLEQDAGKVTGKYCGSRWCLVCNRIRSAQLVVAYAPTLDSWKDKHFLTLTVPNCSGAQLHAVVRDMLAKAKLCQRVLRCAGVPVRALRKLEVTFNARRGDYHPHLHLAVDTGPNAHATLAEWLKHYPAARAVAQDVRPCTSGRELFKYLTKLTVNVEGRHTAPPARALDTIFRAIKGLRTIQPMGFSAIAAVDADDGVIVLDESTLALSARTTPTSWEWHPTLLDWVDYSSGELLSGFTPTPKFLQLLANIRQDAHPPTTTQN